VITATEPRVPGRLLTLKPSDHGAPAREGRDSVSPFDVGCVDWYLYPVSRKARPTGGSRGAPRGDAAPPWRENPSA